MAINFPASPSLNQTYTYEGRTWKWNGVGWQIYVANPSPEVGLNSVSATVSVAAGATATSTVTLHPMVMIHSITSSVPAWVRIYQSSSASSADASRAYTDDPASESGVIAEVATAATNETISLSPVASGINQESPRTSVFPIRVTNNDNAASTVTVTFNYVYLQV